MTAGQPQINISIDSSLPAIATLELDCGVMNFETRAQAFFESRHDLLRLAEGLIGEGDMGAEGDVTGGNRPHMQIVDFTYAGDFAHRFSY